MVFLAVGAAVGIVATVLAAFMFIDRQRYGRSVLAVMALAVFIYLFCTALLDLFPELQ